jgi:hypothetical protein
MLTSYAEKIRVVKMIRSRIKNITDTLYYDIPYAGTFDAFGVTFEYEMVPTMNLSNPRYFVLDGRRVIGTFRLSDLWSDYIVMESY